MGDFKNNPKRFWSFLRCVGGSKSQLSPLLDNNRVVSDDVERAELLNRTFTSKFSNPEVDFYPKAPSTDLPHLTRFEISETQVIAAIDQLKNHKACGPDSISARVIKECANQLKVPLTILFRRSVSEGVFPTRWAEANVVPIHKKGSRKDPSNYRSISLTSLFGKLLERCVCGELLKHVQPALSPCQHGFVPRRSCETNLACLLKTAWKSIDSVTQCDVIYTDYSRAFQSVNHKLLLYKLNNTFQIEGKAIDWLSSYLANRKQRVIVNGKCSKWAPVRSGTPEGGILSPLLFVLFANDLPDKIKTNCLMFADDLKLFHQIRSVEDAETLQADLDYLARWSHDWKLELNPSKCKSFTMTLKTKPIVATYKIQNIPLEKVSCIRDLGVWLDAKLTFAEHVEKIARKANGRLGLMMRSLQLGHPVGEVRRRSLRPEPILAAYFGNVRSILEFGCVIWGGAAKTHMDKLERIQHKFLMWLSFKSSPEFRSLDYADLLEKFKVTSLQNRRKQYDILFLHKILTSRTDSAPLLECISIHVPVRRSRASPGTLLHVPFGSRDSVRWGIFCRGPSTFNAMLVAQPDLDPFCNTHHQFTSRVKNYAKRLPYSWT